MDQTVMSFADAAARTTAIPSPVEGMTTYLSDLKKIEVYNGSAWGNAGTILQVIQGVKTDVSGIALATGARAVIPNLSASITPISTSSKVLVTYDISGSDSDGSSLILKRDSTDISVGDAAGSRTRVTSGGFSTGGRIMINASATVLDSPDTTSSVTYTVDILNHSTGSTTMLVNLSSTDANTAAGPRSASRITLMEVAG